MKGYEFKQLTDESVDLFIMGDIVEKNYWNEESDVGAYDFSKELQEHKGKNLNVHINSNGGDVKEGLAIYNLLKQHDGYVTTYCDGFACSIASVVFMAGKHRVMPSTSLLMIHNAWSYAYGDANDFRKLADDLDKATEPSIQAYVNASNLSRETIKALMDNETWITSDEALEWGFATEVTTTEAKQSLHDQYLVKQILENKRLQKELEQAKNSMQKKEKSSWDDYFNL